MCEARVVTADPVQVLCQACQPGLLSVLQMPMEMVCFVTRGHFIESLSHNLCAFRPIEHAMAGMSTVKRGYLRKVGLKAIEPWVRSLKQQPSYQIFLYLLNGSAVTKLNQVWDSDSMYL